MPEYNRPIIPETITVHLGAPGSNAANVVVPFPDYIKNVASSEIYPTWPESAIRANIYAQISFALNRIYTEWYRSRGYDFDITNNTQYDQKFIYGRDIFENISNIVDDIFNNYVVRQGYVEPLFTSYCNGTTVTCPGLSQWGTVDLANQGMVPYEILQYYYGDNIDIVQNAPVGTNIESYPGAPLSIGASGNDVQILQTELNRIANNYPAIPKINPINGVFGPSTAEAVRIFQGIFGIPQTGVVDKSTWYRIKYIYTSVKNLAELGSEGLRLEDVALPYPRLLREGMRGNEVAVIQYYLRTVGTYNSFVPVIEVDGIFGPKTTEAVKAFQTYSGLTPDGIVGRNTWNALQEAYRGILNTLPPGYNENRAKLYPGSLLSRGSTGQDVTDLQTYLSLIGRTYTNIPEIPVTGYFGEQTENAVRAFQTAFGLEVTGTVGSSTWSAIANEYNHLLASAGA